MKYYRTPTPPPAAVVSCKRGTAARQSPVASGWLGVSGLSAPMTATIKQALNPKSRVSPVFDYSGG